MSRLPDPVTHGLWRTTAQAMAFSGLARAQRADVVVIGAGFTGLSAALHLAQGGCDVAIMEANEVGYGASGRNVGLVNAGLWTMPADVVRHIGHERGERLLAELGSAPSLVFDLIARHGIQCEATRQGTLHCAVGSKGMSEIVERQRQWSERGVELTCLDRAAVAARIGGGSYAGALFDPRAGTIQPLAFAQGLAHAASRHGARIFVQSPVLSAEDLGSGWRLHCPAGSIDAQQVIVATDAYATGPWRRIEREQVRLAYFNMATQPLAPKLLSGILPRREGVWDTRQVLSSFRLDAAGRLVFGSVGALRFGGARIHREWVLRSLARMFPQLGEVRLEHAWYGRIGMTGDALPRFHVLARNVHAVCGYNGRGIAPGTFFGRELARLAMGTTSPEHLSLPATAPTPAALTDVRAAFYEAGASLAHLVSERHLPS